MKNEKNISTIISKYGVLMVFILMFIVFSFTAPTF